jgi:alkaline phosphatase
MATGHKVDNGVLSIVDGADQQTVVEQCIELGKRTGLVTTHTPIVDASPAAFGAHATTRTDYAGIADDLLLRSRPNVLFGGIDNIPSQAFIESAGYFYATTLSSIDTGKAGPSHVFGAFENDASPSLPERARTALEVVEQQPDGFFLFIETEGTDESSHHGDLALAIDAALELEQTVDAVLAWVGSRTDTLVVVLADHETGGLTVTETAPEVGVVPTHTFATSKHTSTPVPVFARGPRAETVTDVMDNTDVYALLGGR